VVGCLEFACVLCSSDPADSLGPRRSVRFSPYTSLGTIAINLAEILRMSARFRHGLLGRLSLVALVPMLTLWFTACERGLEACMSPEADRIEERKRNLLGLRFITVLV
jgi:hypothetical protein